MHLGRRGQARLRLLRGDARRPAVPIPAARSSSSPDENSLDDFGLWTNVPDFMKQ